MMLKNVVVEGDLVLSPPEMTDATELFDIIKTQRDYLEEWMTWVQPIQSLLDTKRYLFDAIRFNEGGQRITYFIKKNTQLVGSVAFTTVNKMHQKAELGYWIQTSFQGQGIMKPSLEKFIAFGFKQKDLNKIEIRISSENERSKKVALVLGFQKEGLLRKDFKQKEKFLDLAIYGLLREDWNKNIRKTNNL